MAKINNQNLALPKGHAERLQFPKLIAKNPNYFGNFPEVKLPPVLQLSNDTVFEELTCVGYNPDRGLLEAVIHVKESSGYSGNDCTPGSFEYIRFFVDTGGGFADAGLVAGGLVDADVRLRAPVEPSKIVQIPIVEANASFQNQRRDYVVRNKCNLLWAA